MANTAEYYGKAGAASSELFKISDGAPPVVRATVDAIAEDLRKIEGNPQCYAKIQIHRDRGSYMMSISVNIATNSIRENQMADEAARKGAGEEILSK
jgi:hypothetical protein